MRRVSDAATLAAARVATAALCATAAASEGASGGAAGGGLALPAAGAYALAALAAFLVARRRPSAARSGGLTMTAADWLFLAVAVAGGEAGALGLPFAAAGARLRGGAGAPAMQSLAAAVFAGAALLSPFWSAHPLLIIAVAAALVAATPARKSAATPVAPRVAGEPPAAPATTAPQPAAEAPLRRRVLIACPAATSRLVLQKVVTRAGHSATAAADGDAVMALLGDSAAPFDVLVLDGDLPDLKSAALARLYRAGEDRAPALRIVGFADRDGDAAAEAIEAGMDVCYPRPVDFAALLDFIAAAPAAAAELSAMAALPIAEPAASASTPEPVAGAAAATDEEAAAAAEGAHPAVDLRALRDLESLGGADFVREIVNQFIVDGASALRNLARLTLDGDVEMFRDQTHALRSSAANVGARRIYETCLAWRAIAPEQLARDGAMHMRTLNRQFQEATAVLEDYIASLGEPAADNGSQQAEVSDAA